MLIGNIMTRNVNLTKEEYCKMLKDVGLAAQDVDNIDEETRLSRIRSNFYGTIINMMFSLLSGYEALAQEIEVFRSQLKALCEKNGIDVSELKTANDKMNEAAAEYLELQNEAMKKAQK